MEFCEVLISASPNNTLIEQSGSDILILSGENEMVIVDVDLDVLLIEDPSILVLSDCVGSPGAPAGLFVASAAENIFQYRVVALDASGMLFMPDQSSLAETRAVLGVALMAGLVGESVAVQTDGVLVTGPLWIPGSGYFLGASGILVDVPPVSGQWLQVAFANSATELTIRPQRLIIRT